MKTSVTFNTYFPKYRAHEDNMIVILPERKLDLIDNKDLYNIVVQRVYREELPEVPHKIRMCDKEYIFDGFMKVNEYEVRDED